MIFSIFSPYIDQVIFDDIKGLRPSNAIQNYFNLFRNGMENLKYECHFKNPYKLIFNGKYKYIKIKNIFITFFEVLRYVKKNSNHIFIVDGTMFKYVFIFFVLNFFLKIRATLLLTDHPKNMHKNIFFSNLHIFFLKSFSFYIVLNEYISKSLNIEKKKIIYHPMIIGPKFKEEVYNLYLYGDYIFYSGGIDDLNNVRFLIKVFLASNLIKYNLIIAGKGNLLERLKKEYNQKNIVFLGEIDYKETKNLMKRATLLISLRKNNHEVTRYSFPFKIMDYISSGTPLVSSFIDSFDSEIIQKIPIISIESEEVASKSLINIVENKLQFLKAEAIKNRDYFYQKYNAEALIKKIIHFNTSND
jgi:hypothetical protein